MLTRDGLPGLAVVLPAEEIDVLKRAVVDRSAWPLISPVREDACWASTTEIRINGFRLRLRYLTRAALAVR